MLDSSVIDSHCNDNIFQAQSNPSNKPDEELHEAIEMKINTIILMSPQSSTESIFADKIYFFRISTFPSSFIQISRWCQQDDVITCITASLRSISAKRL